MDKEDFYEKNPDEENSDEFWWLRKSHYDFITVKIIILTPTKALLMLLKLLIKYLFTSVKTN